MPTARMSRRLPKARGDADVVIVFAEEWRTEALDATGLALPGNQNALIKPPLPPSILEQLWCWKPAGRSQCQWPDKVPAVLEAWYSGLAGGEVIASTLFGRVNPAGRLPLTFPTDEGQLPRPTQSDPALMTSSPGQAHQGRRLSTSPMMWKARMSAIAGLPARV